MDQKNTIIKCKAHPNCLFNYNGVCDNYVINIDEDGKCQCYIDTELIESVVHTPEKIGTALKEISKQMDIQRGQRANGNFIEDAGFNLCSAACEHYDFKGANMYCQLRQEYLGSERLMKPCDLFAKGESLAIKTKVVEFDKPNKNKSIIKFAPLSKEDQEIMNDIGYVPPKYPNYEECWACQYGGSSNMYCSLSVIPMRGPDGKCCGFLRRVEE